MVGDEVPETRYAWSGEDRVAFQVFGEGDLDFLFTSASGDAMDLRWSWPPYADFLRRLGAQARVIMFDRPEIVASTEQLAARGDTAWRQVLDDHDRTMDRIVSEYRGQVVKSTGDGILATFPGPARAVRCAQALLDAAQGQGITLRAGMHTGEIEVRPSDLAGIAVHIANRIATLADPNEILVSRTVLDLTAGSGLQFESRGEHQLKGVPGTWPIFVAHTPAFATS